MECNNNKLFNIEKRKHLLENLKTQTSTWIEFPNQFTFHETKFKGQITVYTKQY